MKKVLSLLLVFILCTGLFAGCGGSPSSTPTPASSGGTDAPVNTRPTKVSAVVISLDSLDPYLVRGAITQGFLTYEPLWTMNKTNDEMLGVIAKDWTIEGTDVKVEIYDYVTDSAGNKITASDVAWSYAAQKEAGTNSNMKYIKDVEVTGDYTVTIHMTAEPWPTLLSTIRVPIISQAAYEDPQNDFVANPIATGHYVVKNFVAANKVVYEKRANHWQSDVNEDLVPYTYKANVDVVELDCILETPQIQNGLETGELQVGSVTATIAKEIENSKSLMVTQKPGKYIHGLMLNCYQGVLADNLTLRQAILYAIDNAAIATAVTKGTGKAAVSIGNDSLAGYVKDFESMDYYNYNLDKAKELMAAAGYPNGGLTLKWLGKTEEAVSLTAQVIQSQLAEIGIKLEISNLDNTTYMAQRPAYNGDWDLCWGDSVPKGNFVLAYQSYVDNTLYDKGNMEGLNDPEMQQIFKTALYDQTAPNILALHNYVRDSASIYGTYVDYDFWAHDKNLTIVTGNDGEIAPNAFILSADYSVFAD